MRLSGHRELCVLGCAEGKTGGPAEGAHPKDSVHRDVIHKGAWLCLPARRKWREEGEGRGKRDGERERERRREGRESTKKDPEKMNTYNLVI